MNNNFQKIKDLAGNIAQIEDWVTANPQVQSFAYDDLNRLTNASASAGNGAYSEIYTYDAATGNLAAKSGDSYAYDANHPHAAASLGSKTYSYDADGNQITRNLADGTYDLKYDSENRLVEVSERALPTPTPTITLSPTLPVSPTLTYTPKETATFPARHRLHPRTGDTSSTGGPRPPCQNNSGNGENLSSSW